MRAGDGLRPDGDADGADGRVRIGGLANARQDSAGELGVLAVAESNRRKPLAAVAKSGWGGKAYPGAGERSCIRLFEAGGLQ